MQYIRRNRNDDTPPEGRKPVVIRITPRDIEIFRILHPSLGHRFLDSRTIRAHFGGKSNDITQRLGHLREHGYLKWSEAPLNVEYDFRRHGIWELTELGAKALKLPLPHFPRNEHAHELLGSLRACSIKFQASTAGVPFAFFPPATYHLPSGKIWKPDEKPILLGAKPHRILCNFEDERRANNVANKEKIDKAVEYIKAKQYINDAESSVALFLSTEEAHTNALMNYVKEEYGRASFLGFATTDDWAFTRYRPDPAIPLVPAWERVGYPPLELFRKEGVHARNAPPSS